MYLLGMSSHEEPLETIRIEPTKEANAVVILMHGLGADGHDFEPLVPELQLPQSLSIRCGSFRTPRFAPFR